MIQAHTPIWVCTDPVDFRLGIDGLAMRVQGTLGPARALTGTHVFFNRARDKVKILAYDRHGWWLCYKRLERGRFTKIVENTLSELDLKLVLEGIDLAVPRLKPVIAQCVA
jgi:hypothetical protein